MSSSPSPEAATSNPPEGEPCLTPSNDETHENLLQELTQTLRNESKKSAFAIGGSVDVVDPDHVWSPSSSDGEFASDEGSIVSNAEALTSKQVIIRWDNKDLDGQSINRITFPVPDGQQSQLEQLVNDCEPAKFGRDARDVFDETYRKAGKLDETSFSTNFNPYSLGIIDNICRLLLPNISEKKVARSVQAELYKLNVYSGPSGMFMPHVDTPRSSSQFGSLVVCLPCSHEGGELVVRHSDDSVVFDWSTGTSIYDTIGWAAFYSDCEHEVLQVTKGHRITLTYNLYVVSTDIPRGLSALDPKTLPFYSKLRQLLAQPDFMENGGLLGIYCTHAYAHTSAATIDHLPWNLKGIDMVAYKALAAAGLRVKLRPILHEHPHSYNNEILSSSEVMELFGLKWDWEKWGRFSEWISDTEEYSDPPDDWYGRKRCPNATEEDIKHRDKLIALYRELDVPNRVLVGDQFREMTSTWAGGEDDGMLDVIRHAFKKLSFLKIKWLNERKHKQPSLAHLTYGNQAGIGIVYTSAAMYAQVPAFEKRRNENES